MKTLEEKMEILAEKGKSAKLIKLASTSKKLDERIAAIAVMRTLREELVIKCLMEILKEDHDDLRKAAAISLDRIATKLETDKLMHFAEVEADADIKKILREAAINSKERTPRW